MGVIALYAQLSAFVKGLQYLYRLEVRHINSNYGNIPEILKQKTQWVVWGVPGEPLKAPFNPESLLRLRAVPAKSGAPETWGAFDDAKRCVRQGLARRVGYEFAGQGIYGVDLDHVIDDSGIITPQAKGIVERLNSYTEVSPSGHGLHIFVTADNVSITRHRKQGGFVEIYSDARYFTVTGNVYDGFDRIANRPVELQEVHDRYLLVNSVECIMDSEGVAGATISKSFRVSEHNHYSLSTIHYALNKDPVLRACWNGERRFGDESASDQALMNKLAYWCNASPASMMAAFLQSPYFTQKDEAHQKKCRRADYLPNTIKAACATLRSTAHEDTMRYRRERDRGEER